MKLEKIEIKCPFCKAGNVVCLYTPSAKCTKRIVTATFGAKMDFKRTKENYDVYSDCPKCGKTKKEIQRALSKGIEDPERDKRIMERLKKTGFDHT
jgi:hypothetical protein